MSKIIETTNLLEDKLETLLEAFAFLKEENEILHSRIAGVEVALAEKQQQFDEKEKSYQLLKIAKTIEGSNVSTKDTKLKINALIRKIDKCIVQLSE